MAVQLNPYAGQVQSAVVNPFQQKDDSSRAVQRDNAPAKTEATAPSEKSESREAKGSESPQGSQETTRSTSQRGQVLDVSV